MDKDLTSKTEIEQLQDMGVLLAAIIRKAEFRAGQDPSAVEIVDLAKRCEALVKNMVHQGSK